jgi:vacuolar protein sorting-associated protein 13B
MYFAFDNSPVLLNDYFSHHVITTAFTLGNTFGSHYLLGAIYRAGNPMRLIGSLELIGSPGTLARSVGSGFKDFVVYPVRGIMDGPLAFMNGLGNGCTSLARHISSGSNQKIFGINPGLKFF